MSRRTESATAALASAALLLEGGDGTRGSTVRQGNQEDQTGQVAQFPVPSRSTLMLPVEQ